MRIARSAPRRVKVERESAAPRKFKWPHRLASLLGEVPDSVVARRAGLHVGTVQQERRRRGIAPCVKRRRPIEWTEEMIARLGEAADREVAAELGISEGSVAYKRSMLGIRSWRTPARKGSPFWTHSRLSLLGKVPDHRLARRWGISSTTVFYRRNRLGIPPVRPRPAAIEWNARMRSWLGREPDRSVARRLGIGANAVREERQRLGIAPARPARRKVIRKPGLRPTLARPTAVVAARAGISPATIHKLRRELRVKATARPSAWTRSALAKLGRVPDEVLAAELGLKPDTVRRKRTERGILKRHLRRWSREEDAIVRALPPKEAAARTGRSLKAVGNRRRQLALPSHRNPRAG